MFDLDGTLANCEHRRQFIDPSKHLDYEIRKYPTFDECINNKIIKREYILKGSSYRDCVDNNFTRFTPDWKSFYEACDKDTPINPTIEILINCMLSGREVEIWSGRCESVREKTMKWIQFYILKEPSVRIKMRPIGDNTPDDVLKERWLDETLAEGKKIDFVFDDRPKVVRMWRRRGIFVFNCCQHDEEF